MKKKKMKEHLLNNIGWKLLSFILAAAAWIVIVNVDDPVITKIIQDVPVDIMNEASVQAKDKVYEVIEGKSVSVYIKGKRKMVDSVNASDIKAVADLSALSNWNAVPIIVTCPRYKELEVSLTGEVQTLKISLEDRVTEQYQVIAETTGEVESGYYIGKAEVKPNLIKVSGGRSAIRRIAEIKVTLDVSGASEDITQSLEPKAYDKDGEEIDSETVAFSTSKVRVHADVLPTKTVPVVVNTKGQTAHGYYLEAVEYEPREVLLAGESGKLEALSELSVSVDLQNALAEKEMSVQLSDLLPEGVVVADANQSISIKLVVDKLHEKEIQIPVEQIDIRNKPDGLTCNFNLIQTYVSVRVLGIREQVDNMDADDLDAYIDLEGYTEGSYTMEIVLENLPKEIEVQSKPVISLTLAKEKEEPEESEKPQASEPPGSETPKPSEEADVVPGTSTVPTPASPEPEDELPEEPEPESQETMQNEIEEIPASNEE